MRTMIFLPGYFPHKHLWILDEVMVWVHRRHFTLPSSSHPIGQACLHLQGHQCGQAGPWDIVENPYRPTPSSTMGRYHSLDPCEGFGMLANEREMFVLCLSEYQLSYPVVLLGQDMFFCPLLTFWCWSSLAFERYAHQWWDLVPPGPDTQKHVALCTSGKSSRLLWIVLRSLLKQVAS